MYKYLFSTIKKIVEDNFKINVVCVHKLRNSVINVISVKIVCKPREQLTSSNVKILEINVIKFYCLKY